MQGAQLKHGHMRVFEDRGTTTTSYCIGIISGLLLRVVEGSFLDAPMLLSDFKMRGLGSRLCRLAQD